MISAGDFKNGLTIEIDGVVYQILEFQHVKPGKGAAELSVQMKNILRLISTRKICSICILREICTTSWIWRHTIRSHCRKRP